MSILHFLYNRSYLSSLNCDRTKYKASRKQCPFENFALRNPAPGRIAEKPERTRVPPRRALDRGEVSAVQESDCSLPQPRARTRRIPPTHIHTCAHTPPVGPIVKERCGWQEWKAHARASGSSARATGPSARAHGTRSRGAHPHTRARTHRWLRPGPRVRAHTRAHTRASDTRARGHPPRTRARTSSGLSRSLRSQNPALALSLAALSRARARTRVCALACTRHSCARWFFS